jgi:hypothetical protein
MMPRLLGYNSLGERHFWQIRSRFHLPEALTSRTLRIFEAITASKADVSGMKKPRASTVELLASVLAGLPTQLPPAPGTDIQCGKAKYGIIIRSGLTFGKAPIARMAGLKPGFF